MDRKTTASGKRKMLAARADLADKVSDIASSKGFTLFHMLNNLLELVVKADDMDISLQETVDTYNSTKAVKEASFTLILENLLYETVEIAYGRAKDKTLKIWFDAGVWVARRYLTQGVSDPLADIGRDLKAFGWNVPEFSVEKTKDGGVSIRVLSPRFSEPYTLLFTCFLEGILETFGYTIRHKEVGKGNIRLEAAGK